MELRDLYDKNKELTGGTIEIGQPVPKDRYYLTVVVFIQNSKNDFLLQLTVPRKHHRWATTGGHPKAGESSVEGIITEIQEELDISINEKELILFKTIKTEDDFVDLYYLKKDIELNSIKIQENEVEKVKWANIEEIDEMIKTDMFLPPHIDFFNYCLDYLKEVNKL